VQYAVRPPPRCRSIVARFIRFPPQALLSRHDTRWLPVALYNRSLIAAEFPTSPMRHPRASGCATPPPLCGWDGRMEDHVLTELTDMALVARRAA
jgi:hypothetical protein